MGSAAQETSPPTVGQIGTLADLTSPRAWVAVATLSFLTVGVVVWGMLGSIYTRVAGLGVALPTYGTLEQVVSQSAGPVSRVMVTVGEHVTKGQTLVLLDQAYLSKQLDGAKASLAAAQSDRDRRASELSTNMKSRQDSADAQIASLQSQIETLNGLIKFRQQYLTDLLAQAKQGFATQLTVQQARTDLATAQTQLSSAQNQITTIQIQLAETEANNDQALAQLNENIIQLQSQVANLTTQLSVSGLVTAPVAGRLVDIAVAPGSVLGVGQSVATIAPGKDELEVVAYFKVGDGKRISPGANALVSFDSVDFNLYGTASGTVTSVGVVPETPQSLINTLGNQTLVQQLVPGFAPLQVRIALKPNGDKPGQYAFSSGRRPPFAITTGTTGGLMVLVSKDRPISFVLPILQDLLGT